MNKKADETPSPDRELETLGLLEGSSQGKRSWMWQSVAHFNSQNSAGMCIAARMTVDEGWPEENLGKNGKGTSWRRKLPIGEGGRLEIANGTWIK